MKPSNVMAVGGESLDDVKITDFGIAKMAHDELIEAVVGGDEASITASQTAIGALPYMSPEMITSTADVGTPADVWSLGAMMFELLTGKKPFGFGYRAVPAILEAKPPKLPGQYFSSPQFRPTAVEVHQIILTCLAWEPGARPSADELVRRCGELCYPNTPREFGVVSSWDNGYWGFITPEEGKGVFFHIESVFGNRRIKVGNRVCFARHRGGGNDRAFPVIQVGV